MKILIINTGSSSIKYQVFSMPQESVLCKGIVDRIGIAGTVFRHEKIGNEKIEIRVDVQNHAIGLEMILDILVSPEQGVVHRLEEIKAVGHRVVHGGERFKESAVIGQETIQAIRDCFELAPAHNPANLAGIEACQDSMPGIPQVAVFDTAFHQTMGPEHFLYALPMEAYEKYKIRRYGFHGTSHDYVSHEAARLLDKPYEDCRIISAHLGNGASITAICGGKVEDTSMGLTPLEGLVMGTRCGDVDPAIVTYLMDRMGLDTDGINDYLNKKSGLLGISGISADMRDLVTAAEGGSEEARMAIEIYILRVKGYIGNYIAKMNGCDCLVFTAGVGENRFEIREKICEEMDWLGISIDRDKNRVQGEMADITGPNSRIKVMVIPTDEERMIARDTYRLSGSI
ncbi:acetate/propionate family kinase [Parasporobacterium paucivorans]|uniref:Acetate kinase n=1 Tax=Parasporobacterium paucivorans DSM 15970 TaxID=1122934 RepID=A0A1M6GIU3_9FIRM|nr:acetate kinase [Parasporobacterium paucivorans]SHJ09839.1 acetate kinase [Parasporobacterium paucivorans DSM 15970]